MSKISVASAAAMVLLMGCLPSHGGYSTSPLQHALVTRQDSVATAWRLVYGYTRAVDHYARPRGELREILRHMGTGTAV